jgi:hypothetical protein
MIYRQTIYIYGRTWYPQSCNLLHPTQIYNILILEKNLVDGNDNILYISKIEQNILMITIYAILKEKDYTIIVMCLSS